MYFQKKKKIKTMNNTTYKLQCYNLLEIIEPSLSPCSLAHKLIQLLYAN